MQFLLHIASQKKYGAQYLVFLIKLFFSRPQHSGVLADLDPLLGFGPHNKTE